MTRGRVATDGRHPRPQRKLTRKAIVHRQQRKPVRQPTAASGYRQRWRERQDYRQRHRNTWSGTGSLGNAGRSVRAGEADLCRVLRLPG
ncbi:hypothetical protein KBX50_09300 [Micromonospora sp. C51]|uniref:hypothetical protein n=1 Tax=Micromonospora sp. C51 TaxID=2824879 RepID=UPI001B37CF51|nr:hypothetical protein [Micromonospora sp. C51]MBQ1048654.1 hypothetical protein [Micromonospora sp. C51]